MNFSRLSVVLLFLYTASFALGDTPATQPASYAAAEQIIRDPHSSDTDAMNAILSIRKLLFRPASAKLWSDVANSDAFSTDRRRWAITQLFDRNVLPGMTLAKIGELLNKPAWLALDGVKTWSNPRYGTGKVTLEQDLRVGEGIVGIYSSLATNRDDAPFFSVVVRSNDQFSEEGVFAALMSQSSATADWHIHEILMNVDYDGDRLHSEESLIRHEFMPYDHPPDAAVASLAEITRQGAAELATLWKLLPKQKNGKPVALGQSSATAYFAAADDFEQIVNAIQMYVGAQIANPDENFNDDLDKFVTDMATLSHRVPSADQANQIRAAAVQIMETSRPMSEDDREIYERNLDGLKWPSFDDPIVTTDIR